MSHIVFLQVSVDGFLMVDALSLAALQIFQEERHPSAMGIGSSKVPIHTEVDLVCRLVFPLVSTRTDRWVLVIALGGRLDPVALV